MIKFNNMKTKYLIVSLTSYPARINSVHLTIESILNQTQKADKIVLWLSEKQFPQKIGSLPESLRHLLNRGLEIGWYFQDEDIKPYNKIINTLEKYPKSIIITVDDDVIYPENTIEQLYKTWLKDTKNVVCNRARKVKYDAKGLFPYNEWELCTRSAGPSFGLLQTGVGAVLYPPKCFHKDVCKKNLFMKLSKDTDDLWLWAMLVLNNTKIIRTDVPKKCFDYIDNTQDIGLWNTKNATGGNDANLKLILEYYPNIMKILNKENGFYNSEFERIFSIKNSNIHKIITNIGLKFKFKSKKLIRRQQGVKELEYSFAEKIFSVKNDDIRKVITILGMKFKFKSKKLIEKKRIETLENNLKKNNKTLKLQGQQLEEQNSKINKQAEKIKTLNNKLENSSNQINIQNDEIKNLNSLLEVKNNEILEHENKINSQGDEIRNLNNLLEVKNKEIFEHENKINSQGDEIKNLNNLLEVKNNEILEHENKINSQGDEIRNLNNLLEVKNNEISEHENKINSQGDEIKNLNNLLEVKNNEILENKNEIAKQQILISELSDNIKAHEISLKTYFTEQIKNCDISAKNLINEKSEHLNNNFKNYVSSQTKNLNQELKNYTDKQILQEIQKSETVQRDFTKQLGRTNKDIKHLKSWQQNFYKENPDEFPVELTEDEESTLRRYLSKSKNYLEFGSGGSTFFAIKNSNTNIFSVESDEKWLDYLRSYKVIYETEQTKRLQFFPIYIGPTKEWGYPVNDDYKDNFPKYSSEVFSKINNDKIDTILIDGRFRVACTLQSILNCKNTKYIIIHDYPNREYYHVLEKFMDIVEVVDKLAIFKIHKKISSKDIENMYEEYKFVTK